MGRGSYIVRRERGDAAANEIAARIDILPVTIRGVNRKVVYAAAMLKAQHPIAYADAFAAATAMALKVPVVTGDPEFRCLKTTVDILWTTRRRS